MSPNVQRREFITLLGGAAAAWPLAVRAQQPEGSRRIGVLMGIAEGPLGQVYVTALLDGLRELGWTDRRNVRIDIRWAAGSADRTQAFAKELSDGRPDVIVGQNTQVVAALLRETRTLPIVFVNVTDPVGSGFVTSFSRPGGNVTGFTGFEASMAGKWLELLKEIAPRVTRAALVFNPEAGPYSAFLRPVETAAASLGVEVVVTPVHDTSEIERVLDWLAPEPNGGLIMLPDNFTTIHRELIISLSARHRIPAVYPFRYIPAEGGLMSYGVDVADLHRRAASYVDRILKGAQPADLPVQAPTKFVLGINLKTAKALGLDVPWFLQQRADEVIE
jgi:putative tryptophan/tyrosine transport system substrate-binding protein